MSELKLCSQAGSGEPSSRIDFSCCLSRLWPGLALAPTSVYPGPHFTASVQQHGSTHPCAGHTKGSVFILTSPRLLGGFPTPRCLVSGWQDGYLQQGRVQVGSKVQGAAGLGMPSCGLGAPGTVGAWLCYRTSLSLFTQYSVGTNL